MGMEALETVIAYWEDALAAYNPTARLVNLDYCMDHAGKKEQENCFFAILLLLLF